MPKPCLIPQSSMTFHRMDTDRTTFCRRKSQIFQNVFQLQDPFKALLKKRCHQLHCSRGCQCLLKSAGCNASKSCKLQAALRWNSKKLYQPGRAFPQCGPTGVSSAWSSPQTPCRTLRTRGRGARECEGVSAWLSCRGTSCCTPGHKLSHVALTVDRGTTTSFRFHGTGL